MTSGCHSTGRAYRVEDFHLDVPHRVAVVEFVFHNDNLGRYGAALLSSEHAAAVRAVHAHGCSRNVSVERRRGDFGGSAVYLGLDRDALVGRPHHVLEVLDFDVDTLEKLRVLGTLRGPTQIWDTI